MKLFEAFLLLCLIVCALAVSFTKDLSLIHIYSFRFCRSNAITWF